jgi:hypothetical protein
VFDGINEMSGLPAAPGSVKAVAAKQTQRTNAASLRILRELAPVFD